MRLNDWKMNPILFARSADSALSPRPSVDVPSRRTCPEVGLSRHPIWFSRVVLPDPEGPTNAVNSPGSIVRLTSSTAWTAATPSP